MPVAGGRSISQILQAARATSPGGDNPTSGSDAERPTPATVAPVRAGIGRKPKRSAPTLAPSFRRPPPRNTPRVRSESPKLSEDAPTNGETATGSTPSVSSSKVPGLGTTTATSSSKSLGTGMVPARYSSKGVQMQWQGEYSSPNAYDRMKSTEMASANSSSRSTNLLREDTGSSQASSWTPTIASSDVAQSRSPEGEPRLFVLQHELERLEAENKTLQERRKVFEESIESKEKQEAEMREELDRLLQKVPEADGRLAQSPAAGVDVPAWPLAGKDNSSTAPPDSTPSQREAQLEEEMSEIRKAFEAVEMQQRRKDAEAQRLEAELRQSLDRVLRDAERKSAEAERLREELRASSEVQTQGPLPAQGNNANDVSILEAENRDLRESNRRLEEGLQAARRESAAISTTLLGEISALNGAQHRMAAEVERLQRCFPEQQAELQAGAQRMRELAIENEELRWHLAECQTAMNRKNGWDMSGTPLGCSGGLAPLMEEDSEGPFEA